MHDAADALPEGNELLGLRHTRLEQAPRARLAVNFHAAQAPAAVAHNRARTSLDGLRHGPFHRQIFLAFLFLQFAESPPAARELLRVGGVRSRLAEQVLEGPQPRGFLAVESQHAAKAFVRRADAA